MPTLSTVISIQIHLYYFFSTDCGVSFTPFWYIGGADLATAPPTQNEFVPTANQWNWNQVSLGFLAGQNNVHIAIANLSGWGNNLYLDEISFVDAADYTNQGPTADFRTATTIVCAGDIVQFQDRSIQFPSQWAWQFPGGFPSETNLQHPFVLYNTPGTFSVGQGVSNFFGTDTEVKNNYIQVVALPNISVSADQLPVCGGQPVVLTASGAAFYEWYDQRSGILIHEGPAIEATLFEDWTFTIIGYNQAGCSSQATYLVTISAPPQPTITVQGQTLSSSLAAGYQWYVNGEAIPINQGGSSQSIQPQISGLYVVQTFDGTGCSNISLPVQFSPSTSVSNLNNINQYIKAFPNPVDGALFLSFDPSVSNEIFNLEITNTIGTIVYAEKILENKYRL
jgi:PKD repeat protein